MPSVEFQFSCAPVAAPMQHVGPADDSSTDSDMVHKLELLEHETGDLILDSIVPKHDTLLSSASLEMVFGVDAREEGQHMPLTNTMDKNLPLNFTISDEV